MTMMMTPQPQSQATTPYDVIRIRADFPILTQTMHGKPLVYLDNGATTQKPQAMIDCISQFYAQQYGTVRRGVYELSARSTLAFEQVREQVAGFLNAASPNEIIFTRGTTEAINLVAYGYGRTHLKTGDEILISAMEHHANIVPWQEVCKATGAVLKVIPMNDAGELQLDALDTLLTSRTKMVAVTYVSNALGTINPVQTIVQRAHAVGAVVLVDGAQSAPHMAVDVQQLDCDFYAFSGHKIYGPTGIGVLYGKAALLESMSPWQTGGDMIEWVTFEKTTFAKPPNRFEAGTPPIAEVIGLGASLTYLQHVGMDAIAQHETMLLNAATPRLQALEGIRLVGTAAQKAGVISFVFEDIHPHDVGTILDREGIAVRAGHHCAQPVMQRFGVPATTRVSFGMYNTLDEVDRLIEGLNVVLRVFRAE